MPPTSSKKSAQESDFDLLLHQDVLLVSRDLDSSKRENLIRRYLLSSNVDSSIFQKSLTDGLKLSEDPFESVQKIVELLIWYNNDLLKVAKKKVFLYHINKLVKGLSTKKIKPKTEDQLKQLGALFERFLSLHYTSDANKEEEELLITTLAQYVQLTDLSSVGHVSSDYHQNKHAVILWLIRHNTHSLIQSYHFIVDIVFSIGNVPSLAQNSLLYLLYKDIAHSGVGDNTVSWSTLVKYFIVSKRGLVFFQSLEDAESIIQTKARMQTTISININQLISHKSSDLGRSICMQNTSDVAKISDALLDDSIVYEDVLMKELNNDDQHEGQEEDMDL